MFYDKFIEKCKEKNISPYTILRENKLSTGSLSAWKNGTIPNVFVIYDIAKYFNVRIEDLIEREYL